jgi:hypothetical protein
MAARVKAASDPDPSPPLAAAGTTMNTDLKNFVLPIARTVSATLFFVFSVAFLSVPYSLEQDPSDAQQLTHPVAPRHMT